MKVLMINGSPNKAGCTYTALREVEKGLLEGGMQTELIHLEESLVRGCIGCGHCRGKNRCVFDGDGANRIIESMEQCDGLVIGSPVYYAGPNGTLLALLDRVFYAAGRSFAYKPGAAVVSARRGGTTAALDRLNKYFHINQMPQVSSQYWNMVHGNTPEEVARDLEGLQIMRTLGRNMAWLIRSIEAGRAAGLPLPAAEPRVGTNFIREA